MILQVKTMHSFLKITLCVRIYVQNGFHPIWLVLSSKIILSVFDFNLLDFTRK